MDLESTLIRAEALFRRFKRMVEAIRKKENFPEARRESRASPPAQGTPTQIEGSPQGRGAGKAPAAQETQAARVLTPELLKLLETKVEVLPKRKPGNSAR